MRTTTIAVGDVDRDNAETIYRAGYASSFSEACRIALAVTAAALRPTLMTPKGRGSSV